MQSLNSSTPTAKSLRKVPLFRDLDEAALSELSALLTIDQFPAGTRLFRAGDAGDAMFLVESGRVQIKLSDTEGDEFILADLRSGEFFGELALLDGKPRSADALIVENATLAKLSRPTFLSLIGRRSGIVLPLLSAMTHRLRRTDELLRHRVARNANEEVAARATLADRAADLIASFGGSWKFIIAAICFLVVWVIGNSWLLYEKVFDPFPYIFLNLVLNMVTALQAPIIMMSQNRQVQKDRIRGDLDYRVNLNNELMLSEIARRLDALEQQFVAMQADGLSVTSRIPA
jgi:CRP/FNR family transcriptional regulator, cyclic AMP receptor protein